MSESSESIKTVLGELLNNADAVTQRVLRLYNSKVQYQTNLTNMLKCDANELESCATYLGFIVRGDEETPKKLYQNQKVLCDRIILKIESLFDTKCDDCDEIYRNQLAEKPQLTCQICMQGCHNCESMQEMIAAYEKLCSDNLKPYGLTWICHGCLKKNNLDLLPSKRSEGNKTPSRSLQDSLDLENDNQVDKDPTKEEEEKDNEAENRGSPRRGRNVDPNTNICEEYKKMKCPHGLTGKRFIDGVRCPKNHPPRCHRFCGFGDNKKMGCKRGSECKYYHPKLCQESLKKRMCLNRDCTLVHLKFTRRTQSSRTQETENYGPSNSQWRPDRKEPALYRRDSFLLPPPPRARMNSTASAYPAYTPYPSTVDAPKTQRVRIDDIPSEKDNSFLEKLLENLKDGIVSQMDAKLSELRTQIPSIILESDQWTKTLSKLKPPTQQLAPCQYQQIPQIQLHQVPAPSQMMQMPFNSYPGLSY